VGVNKLSRRPAFFGQIGLSGVRVRLPTNEMTVDAVNQESHTSQRAACSACDLL
jgi:hypothetical protein